MNRPKAVYKEKWAKQHPKSKIGKEYYKLTRNDQAIIFQLRAEHYRFGHHLYQILKIVPKYLYARDKEQQMPLYIP